MLFRTAAVVFSSGLSLATLFVLTGCADPFNQPFGDQSYRERLGSIERTALEDHVVEPAITAKQAQAASIDPIPEPEPAEAVRELTIEDARMIAIKHNLGLRVERLDPAIAAETVTEEEARFEAVFFGTTQFSHKDPRLNRDVPGTGAPGVEQWANEVGIEVPLRTGGTATVSTAYFSQDVDLPGVPDAEEAATRFSISQPLLRDAGRRVNEAPIRVARVRGYQAQARSRLAVIRVMAETERAYWQLHAAARQVDVQREQYENALEQLERARRLAEEGVVAGLEAERARAGLSRRVDAVIVAETRRRQAERALKRVVNDPDLPVRGPTVLITASQPNPIRLSLDPTDFTEHALANRMEMLELELQLAIEAVQVDLARNRTLPLVALQFEYGFHGSDRNARGAYNAMFDGDMRDWTAGAQVRVPLGNEAAKANLRRALLQRIRTTGSRADQAQQIQQDVYDALDQLNQNWRRILAAQREVVLQGRIYEAEQRQFQAGMVTMTDVLEAAQFLADAQLREVDALTAYEISKVEFAFATGTVLGHGQVHWPDEKASNHSSHSTRR